MSKSDILTDEARAVLAQKHQIDQVEHKLGDIQLTLDAIRSSQSDNDASLDEMIANAERALEARSVSLVCEDADANLTEAAFEIEITETTSLIATLDTLDAIRLKESASWEHYLSEVESYCARNRVEGVKDPFSHLMTTGQRVDLERRIQQEFTLKGSNCDKYDYMIAGTCGLIGGLIDVLFVGMPGQGALTKVADNWTDGAVQKFARLVGWKGPNEGKDPTASAIGFLEGRYKINYDHRHGVDVGGLFKMSTKNHHIKSLGHSPDLVGLFFSILDQFTSSAHFVSDGRLICIDTQTFELQGNTLAAKLFAGFVNWLGHLFSDVAGSSGATGRGSGIPIPFYSLLQFIDVGEFGQHKQTFATIAVQVFERGYDFRHGIAMSIPVVITELLTRMLWVVKQRFHHQSPWRECVPTAAVPELRRMLLVAHGTLCLVDAADAGLRSGGDMIQFMLRSNLIAWTRFGTIAIKELMATFRSGALDIDAVDEYLEAEYRRMAVS